MLSFVQETAGRTDCITNEIYHTPTLSVNLKINRLNFDHEIMYKCGVVSFFPVPLTMRRSWAAGELARAMISSAGSASHHQSQPPLPSRKWAPALEQILHRFGCRDSLTPALVAGVIDPFLLHHHSLALGFFNWASQQPGFSHTSATYQSILKSLSIARQFNNLENVLKQIKALNIHIHPSVYGTVISSLITGRKTQVAFSIFHRIGAGVSDIGSCTCNSLLAALSSEGNTRDAQILFDEMLQRGIPLTTVGFGVFIWRFCRNAQVEQILKLLDYVKNGEISGINGSIIAVLVVHGLCSESRAVEAMPLLDELRKRECKPDFIAYRIVAEAFREMGCAVDVVNALKKKRKLGVAPRASDYREFIFALITERLIFEAKELAGVIVSGNFPIEDDVLNALIGSVSTIDPSSAVSLLKYMLHRGMLPTLLALTNLSGNLCKHGSFSELVEVFELLSTNDDFFTDVHSYHVKITFLCKAGRPKEAYESLQEMKKKGLVPDVSCYNTLLEACCREDLIRPAKRLWDEMFKNGFQGNVQSYSILIQKLAETGEIEEGYRLLCQMEDRGVLPDETIYTSILAGLCEAKSIDTAIAVLNKSSEQDANLGHTTLTAFILHLCRQGLFLPASDVLTSRSPELGNLDANVTFLKFLAEAGELLLAISHLRWIGDKSPQMFDALRASILSFSSSSKLRAVLKSYEEQKPQVNPILDF